VTRRFAMPNEEILNGLTAYIKGEFNIFDELSGDTNLQDAGLDSLDIVNLLFLVEERYGVKIPAEVLDERTLIVLGKMVEYIDSNRA